VLAGGKLVVSQGGNYADQVVSEYEGEPRLYLERQGNGLIVTSTFDLLTDTNEAISAEKDLWLQLIGVNWHYSEEVDYWQNYWGYLEAANIFEDIKSPQLPTLIVIFLGYLLIISPAFYLAMKRYDKREWLWVIIPLTAIIFTTGISAVGKGRISGDGVLQTVARVNIIDSQLAEVRGAGAVIIPKGGSYNISVSDNTFAIPSARYRSNSPNTSVTIDQGGNKTIGFNRVEYWSLRNVIFSNVKTDLGAIEGRLSLVDDVLTGTLINNTSMDLEEVIVTIGSGVYQLGDWEQGESKSIQERLDWQNMNNSMEKGYYYPMPGQTLSPQRERLMYSVPTVPARPVEVKAVVENYLPQNPVIVPLEVNISGWSNQELELLDAVEYNVAKSSNILVLQTLTVDLGSDDRIFIPFNYIKPKYQGQISYEYYGPNHRGIDVQGIVSLDFVVGKDMVVERLYHNFSEIMQGDIRIEIFNWQENEWELLTDSLTVLKEDKAKALVSDEGNFRMRLINESGIRKLIPEPAIQVLGREK
ncbi:MAG: hypothetical protein SCK28_09370, partial [Bacillota bacterium]|nr:hypothetical protein [Bacillota bacterium]